MDTDNTSWKHYIGIDPSLNGTGLAVLSVDGDLRMRRTLRISPARILSEQAKLLYIYRIATDWLTACTRDGRVAGICMEGPSLGSEGRQDILGEVRGILKLVSAQITGNTNVLIVTPSGLKKFASGYGASSKDGVQAGMEALSWRAGSDDEYDAAALAEYCYAKQNDNAALSRKQREALSPRKKKPTRRWTKTGGINV